MREFFGAPVSGSCAIDFCSCIAEVASFMTASARKTRAIAVQLTPQTVKRLDELAERSKMSRHRYMILVLERAVKNSVVVREEVAFSDE